jgi:6-pyruvoyltetrahydropterin/6-carboxytetrahydropterin synthase
VLSITRTFQFAAGHRLFRPDWSDAENAQVFGLCANPNGHGHNYTLEVSVTGPLDAETGMIMNLRELKETVRERVIADVDHKNLNADVAWMRGAIPTTEVFAERLWARLEDVLKATPHVTLERIVLHETPNNKVTRTR